MTIKFSDLQKNIVQGKISPVYFFTGEENFLKEEALGILKKHFFSDASSLQFNYNLYYAAESDAEKILDTALTLPFLSPRRLIVIKEAEKLKCYQQENLVNYLANPAGSACLVFMAEKMETKNKYLKLIQEAAEIVQFWPMYPRQVPSWIMQRVIGHGKKRISLAAAEYLQEIAGNNLWDLHQEVEKLLLYTDEQKEITIDDVAAVSGHIRCHNIFEYLRLLNKKDRLGALKVLVSLCAQGEQPIMILTQIYRRYQKMLIAKKYFFDKQPAQSVSQAMRSLGISSFFEPDFPDHLQNFSEQQLKGSLGLILEADREIKTGRKTGRLALEVLSYKLCSV